ncbi:MAG TPA: sigma-54 dependent transcriptional regulator [Gemmataceae bacterium]|jgi:two-component system nitrogen regulation response regulator GlnG|nr:sigma-54 dependent transcriptional regulator [Gemmataceae bacterium]
MPVLLVIDDEESVCYSFRRVFASEQVTVITAGTCAEGLALARAQAPTVVVVDLQLPDGSGMDLLPRLRELDAKRPIIIITAHGTTQTAIEAMKSGAFDYLIKPLDLERLSQVVERAFDAARLMNVPATLPTGISADQIIGRSPVMQEMCKAIGRIAPQDVNVLIRGESGTGKELVARALYHHSKRNDKPFLAINCAAIPEALLESELFGHEKGAFTGADRRRIGKFEQVNGGTLFLDEIGDMPPALQAKMLRILQEQRFERLGGNEVVQTQVRVLTATNQDLEKLVKSGRFRKDLYYRLKVVTIPCPPLRDHLNDVAELAHYFLYRFDRDLGMDFQSLAPETLELLENYSWPGNVRELQSAIKQAMLNASGQIILPEFLPAEVQKESTLPSTPVSSGDGASDLRKLIDGLLARGEKDLHRKVVEAIERVLLPRVLRETHGHQAQASEILGVNRATLRHKLRTLGLGFDKVVTDESAEEK